MNRNHEGEQMHFPKADVSSLESCSAEVAQAVRNNCKVRILFRTSEGGELSVADEKDITHHLMLSAAGTGRSFLLSPIALRKQSLRAVGIDVGASAEDMLRKQRAAEQTRLNAVREAFWNATPEGHEDFNALHDLVVVVTAVKEPTPEQIKALFMMLPAEVLGSALAWGFSDTDVRERIYAFVEKNSSAVLEAINAEQSPSPNQG